jgi:putative transposase
MPRIARVVAPEVPHHVTQRGNNRTEVFLDDADRERYLKTLVRYCEEFKVSIWAYCLMTNHVHLLAVPEQGYSLAQGIGRTNLIYTQYANAKYGRTGRLWQNRFFSCPVEQEQYLWAVVRYIETNPVRAGLVRQAWDYRWSSARHHVRNEPDLVLGRSEWLDRQMTETYREYLMQDSQADVSQVRYATRTGRPLGSASFITRLETKLGRTLRLKKSGRPFKR